MTFSLFYRKIYSLKNRNMEHTVIHDEKVGRFEVFESGQMGYLQYEERGNVIDLLHTIVPKQLEGEGVGSALVQAALNYARSANLKVIPTCPFVKTYIERHPEYKNLVA
jgi:predicted GNAT family acetyltransferase